MANIAILVLRLGIGFVFVVFGLDKLFHPERWIIFLPTSGLFRQFSQQAPAFVQNFFHLQGIVELLIGGCLALGFMARPAAVLASTILALIVFTLGWDPIGIRDVGLLSATIALFFLGAGTWSIDYLVERKNGPVS